MMKSNKLVSSMIIVFIFLVLASCAYGTPLTLPAQDNSNYRFRTITIEHKTSETGPWIPGRVSPKAVKLRFVVEFDTGSQMPDKILLRVELRRLCRLKGSGGNILFARFQNYFISHEEEVTVNSADRTAEIILTVHCATCPHPTVCVFPDSDLDKDGDEDHLGEGPYEALITAAEARSKQSSDSRKPLTDASQLVHSKYFSTCVFKCVSPKSRAKKHTTPPQSKAKS